MPKADVQRISNALKDLDSKIIMFADGFVDEVWEIVSSRASLTDFSVYNRMNQFAERITNSGSGGVGLELVRKRRAFGGFTANIGYAAARLGVDTAMVGVYGNENLDPIFNEVNDICRVFSLADPAITHVFEFDDGKILMSHMEAVQDISWNSIIECLGKDKVVELLTESSVIGVGYWSLLPAFDEIITEACALLPNDGKKRRCFFDFADFRKKDESSLKKSLGILKDLNGKIPMSLSVNEHEAVALFAMHNETLDNERRPISEKTEYVRQQIGLDELVIHTPHFAAAASSSEKAALVESEFCEKPVRSAGAGDTFNGGYIAASLAKLELNERLHTANAAVGYFLRTGIFPDREQILKHL